MSATARSSRITFTDTDRRSMPTEIIGEVHIQATPESVWEEVANLGGIQAYHPAVKKSYYSSQESEGVGASRVCEFGGGRSVEEHAVNWQDGSEYVLELRNGKGMPPFRRAVGHLQVIPEEEGATVRLAFRYGLRFGPLGALMDRMMVRRQFSQMVPRMLQGLKAHVEA